MGYLFLAFANLAGTVKGYCGKRVSDSVKKTSDAMLANFLRMIICSLIGFAVVVIIDSFSNLAIGAAGLFISLLSGVSSAVFVISWLFAVSRGAYMLVDVFLTVGLVIPITLCSIFFGEEIKWNHLVGFVILIIAVWVMCSYSSSVKSKLSVRSLLLLLLCGLSQGLSSFSQKWFVYHTGGSSIPAFNFYTYVFAAVALLLSFIIMNRCKEKGTLDEKFTLRPVWHYITVMALMLFLYSYLMTLAATKLDAVLLYPISTGLSLILSAVMCSIFFKEKINAKCLVGILLAFCSIVFINFL